MAPLDEIDDDSPTGEKACFGSDAVGQKFQSKLKELEEQFKQLDAERPEKTGKLPHNDAEAEEKLRDLMSSMNPDDMQAMMNTMIGNAANSGDDVENMMKIAQKLGQAEAEKSGANSLGKVGPRPKSSATNTAMKSGADLSSPADPAALDLQSMNPTEIDNAYKGFLEEVDEVSQQVQDLISGKITDFDAWDAQQLKKEKKKNQQNLMREKIKKIREKEQAEKIEKLRLFGRDGKGEKDDYKMFCKSCFTEYLHDEFTECYKCKRKLITQAERKKELYKKLDIYKEEKKHHQFRKDKWNRWKKSQALLGKSKVINYKAWEYWEPDSEGEDEENMEPVVPKDDPQFKAMELDIKKRAKERNERFHIAMSLKVEGNKHMKDGDYTRAIEKYEAALEKQKDFKPLWTNKAMAEIKIFRYEDAVDSCSKVLELCEIFEDGFEKSKDFAFKAFTRRAQAYRGLYKWSEAVDDLKEAIKLYPKDHEVRVLLKKTKEAAAEARYSEEIARVRRNEEKKRSEMEAEIRRIEKDAKEGDKTDKKIVDLDDIDEGDEYCGVKMEEVLVEVEPTREEKTQKSQVEAAEKSAKKDADLKSNSSNSTTVSSTNGTNGMKRIQIEDDSSEDESEPEMNDENSDDEDDDYLTKKKKLDKNRTLPPGITVSKLLGSIALKATTDLSETDFGHLLLLLEQSKDERILFCSRAGSEGSTTKKSRLEFLIQELETLSIRWKKQNENNANTKEPKRQDKKDKHARKRQDKSLKKKQEKENKETEHGILRIISVLDIIVSESDFHCELCSHAAKFLWPICGTKNSNLLYYLLRVLEEMSQRNQSAVSMGEFIIRYPEKLQPIIKTMEINSRENVVAPEAQKLLQDKNVMKKMMKEIHKVMGKESDQLNAMMNQMGVSPESKEDKAEQEEFLDLEKSLIKPSSRDLVFGILCNLTLYCPKFRTTLSQHKSVLIEAIRQKIEPMNYKTGAINLLCNLVGKETAAIQSGAKEGSNQYTGTASVVAQQTSVSNPIWCAEFTQAAVKHLIDPILDNFLGIYEGGSNKDFLDAMFPPEQLLELKEQYLGALLNLVQVSTEGREKISKKLSVLKPYLLEYEGEVLARTLNILQKVFLQCPDMLDVEWQSNIYKVLNKSIALQTSNYKCKKSTKETSISKSVAIVPSTGIVVVGKAVEEIDLSNNEEGLKFLEISIRTLTSLMTKSKSFQDLFVNSGKAKKKGNNSNEETESIIDPKLDLIPNLVRLVCLLRPKEYIHFDNKKTAEELWFSKMLSNIRGNLSLIFAHLVQLEIDTEKIGGRKLNFGLGGVVEVFVDYLRKERDATQTNAGVTVTKMATSERYRPLVRQFKGFESLHQIQVQKMNGAVAS